MAIAAQAQTYTVLHYFNGSDGSYPTSTLIFDRAGNLYGTTASGGEQGNGVVFQLKRTPSGDWIYTPIHKFNLNDGSVPLDYGGLTLAPDGTIYGTTNYGGMEGCDINGYCGTVFRLQPPPTACTTALCSWLLTTIYEFNPQSGTHYPDGSLIFDAAGNLYGTAGIRYGTYNSDVYELTPAGGNWIQNSYSLDAGTYAGLIFDNAGNLYGVGSAGLFGVVFKLTPSGSGWTKTILYNFTNQNDGAYPFGGLIFDSAGNLYGSTSYGGSAGGGTIFELSPYGGGWNLTTLCSFGNGQNGYYGPQSALTMDAAGNLYGTTYGDGVFFDGMVFKATRSGNSWTCSDLFDFQSGLGLFPIGGVAVDASGNLYGTASQSGVGNNGVLWEITP
jgi:uncharacterized repeat protein (TIGR03803 family)